MQIGLFFVAWKSLYFILFYLWSPLLQPHTHIYEVSFNSKFDFEEIDKEVALWEKGHAPKFVTNRPRHIIYLVEGLVSLS